MTTAEFESGLEDRYARVVIAASNCVRYARRDIKKVLNRLKDDDDLLTALSHTRFNPVYQRELVEAVDDLHNFQVSSGKYKRPSPG